MSNKQQDRLQFAIKQIAILADTWPAGYELYVAGTGDALIVDSETHEIVAKPPAPPAPLAFPVPTLVVNGAREYIMIDPAKLAAAAGGDWEDSAIRLPPNPQKSTTPAARAGIEGLTEIIALARKWDANQRGGIAHQRKRWIRLADIAADTLQEIYRHIDPIDGEATE